MVPRLQAKRVEQVVFVFCLLACYQQHVGMQYASLLGCSKTNSPDVHCITPHLLDTQTLIISLACIIEGSLPACLLSTQEGCAQVAQHQAGPGPCIKRQGGVTFATSRLMEGIEPGASSFWAAAGNAPASCGTLRMQHGFGGTTVQMRWRLPALRQCRSA
jgi:hypothetical protein